MFAFTYLEYRYTGIFESWVQKAMEDSSVGGRGINFCHTKLHTQPSPENKKHPHHDFLVFVLQCRCVQF
jgi:hypothetical protein